MEKSFVIQERIGDLQKYLVEHNLDAYIIPGTDPHQNEWSTHHWEAIRWLSGFSGENATMVITLKEAALWADSRFYIQGEMELEDTGIEFCKIGMKNVKNPHEWIISRLEEEAIVGCDGRIFSIGDYKRLQKQFKARNISLVMDLYPLDTLWHNRPVLPKTDVFIHPAKYTTLNARQKMDLVLKKMKQNSVSAFLITKLDEIAWLLNIRGNDIPYNPLSICYFLLRKEQSILFIEKEKVSSEIADYLNNYGIIIEDYNRIFFIQDYIEDNSRILLPELDTAIIFQQLLHKKGVILNLDNPVTELKAVKDKTEAGFIKNAMKKDGIALVRFLYWFDTLENKSEFREIDLSEQLIGFRKEQDGYMGESFPAIIGFKGNGAIVHYQPGENSARLEGEGLLLVDCGAHYLDGTTDLTRVLSIGTPTNDMKNDFTLVLKGHIALAKAVFPEGTRGYQLDTLARQPLWNHIRNYGHGTGHGVGYFLNVHEGPQSISTRPHDAVIKKGMVSSNEPGIYRKDKYGIRIENLTFTHEYQHDREFGLFFNFETLTLCPIEKDLINTDLLTKEEVVWINTYHEKVYQELNAQISKKERDWLRRKTLPFQLKQ